MLGDFYYFGTLTIWQGNNRQAYFDNRVLINWKVLIMSANIIEMVKAVKLAVSNDIALSNKWEKAGEEVAKVYPTAQALEEVKAQFIADCILPALDKRHSEALAKDIPRKGSKEYNALAPSEVAKWELVNQAKKDARATCNTYFSRVKGYAYGKEKKESVKKSFVDKISALIVEGGKITECDFDLVAVMGFLIQAEKAAKGTK